MISVDKIKNNFFWIPSALMVIDAILKFFHIILWEDLSWMGEQNKIVWLGITELCCLVIFLLPRTLTLGFFLLCCFWGVEIVANLKSMEVNLFPIGMLALFALAAYWRDSFLLFNKCSNDLKQ
jgi:hypothetical protein